MRFKKAFQTSILVFIALGMVVGVSAQQTSSAIPSTEDESDIVVQVSEKIGVDIHPQTLDYQAIEPGERALETADNYTHVEIENIGSENITKVWMNATSADQNPFGTGLASNYNAGNFVEVRPTGEITGVSSDTEHTFVNRKEYNVSNDLSYVFTQNNDWEYGRFRVNDQEVFWAVEHDSANPGQCTTGGDNLRVGNEAHNQTNTGASDFRDSSSEYTSYALTSGNQYEVANNVEVSTSESTRNYDLVVNCGTGQTWVTRTKYNPEAEGEALTGVSDYIVNASSKTSNEAFQPGEYFELETAVNVPLGVAQGQINNGVLRVLVSST